MLIWQQWEKKFKEQYTKSFPGSLCQRIPNQMSGFAEVNNSADFLCYDGKRLYYIDCKAHKGASFPFSAFPQFERLWELRNIPNLITGIALWLYERDGVFFVPTYTIEEMKKDGFKSINPKKVNKSKYFFIEVPSVKVRVFMNSDWTVLTDVPDYISHIEDLKRR